MARQHKPASFPSFWLRQWHNWGQINRNRRAEHKRAPSTRTWEQEGASLGERIKEAPTPVGQSGLWLQPCPGPHLPWHPAANSSAEGARSVPEKDATALHGNCYFFKFFFSFSITRCSVDSKINKAWFPVSSCSLSPKSSHSSHRVLSDRRRLGQGWAGAD